MKFILERVVGPDIEPLTLVEVKRHLRMFDSVATEDDDVLELISAAREWAEDFTGRAFIDQTWRMTLGDTVAVDPVQTPGSLTATIFPTEAGVPLRKSPIIGIESFVSVDAAGVETDLDPATYALREADSKWPRVVSLTGTVWSTGMYRIVYRAGFANRDISPQEDASVVPTRYKRAMKLWIEANYDRDERMMATLLEVAEKILRPERCELGLA